VDEDGYAPEYERRPIDVVQHIKKQNLDCRIPIIHWHNLDEPLKIPCIILMDLVPGGALSTWNASIPTNSRYIFLDSLAQFLLELWSTNATETTHASEDTLSYS
jgi:hypothetical protein